MNTVFILTIDDYESSEIHEVYSTSKKARKAQRNLKKEGIYSNLHEFEVI